MIRLREGDRESILTMEEFEHLARRGEISPFAEVCLPVVTGERFVRARELPIFTAVYDPRRQLFQRHFHLGRLPLLTGVCALICVGLFFIGRELGDGVATRDALLALGAKARARITDDGELWRLLTANLLHRDVAHLAFNLFALLNVGTVLEGVYRRGDYLLLLLIGGLSTMTVSTLASGSITVGASGMIFACLGAAVVFGLRFAELLPLRYRLYFGVVVLVYAAVMFTLGLQRTTTDNWGHGGGLLSGLAMGALLEPRLMRLREAREPKRALAMPWLASAVVVATTIGFGPLVPWALFRFEPYHLDNFGIVISRPATWSKGPDPFGSLAFGNGVDALTSIACAQLSAPATLEDAGHRFVERELRTLARSGSIGQLVVGEMGPDAVGDAQLGALRVPFSFMASDGPFRAEATIFLRGEIECVLVLAHREPASLGAIAVLGRVKEQLRFVETRAQRDARNATLNRPRSVRAQLDLAHAHQQAGQVHEARAAFEAAWGAVRGAPAEHNVVQLARARFELGAGRDLDAALAHAETARVHDPADVDAAVVLIEVLVARGDLERAQRALVAALVQFPDERRLGALRASVGGTSFAPGPDGR